MSTQPFDDPEQNEREEHIEELQRQAHELTGGEMVAGGAADAPPEVREQFWEHVVQWEEAPWTTDFDRLQEAGIGLPAPETLADDQVSMKLWEIIDHLARRRVFLNRTDHLSDRELYTLLWSDLLHEETKDVPMDEYSACHIDLLSGGSEEDNQLYLKYYADDKERAQWHQDYPEDSIPAHADPPYDRDQHLPQPAYPEPDEDLGYLTDQS
ncbi:MAG TPA: hypothetical protein VMT20_01540 [Terriglobia bacterium]|nr:hypothetical protein [Terriglobia bacterium]